MAGEMPDMQEDTTNTDIIAAGMLHPEDSSVGTEAEEEDIVADTMVDISLEAMEEVVVVVAVSCIDCRSETILVLTSVFRRRWWRWWRVRLELCPGDRAFTAWAGELVPYTRLRVA
ncbi:unnamed protein product [Cercospora beticola]|nr:unnamed protein product [Cercospora beticola]